MFKSGQGVAMTHAWDSLTMIWPWHGVGQEELAPPLLIKRGFLLWCYSLTGRCGRWGHDGREGGKKGGCLSDSTPTEGEGDEETCQEGASRQYLMKAVVMVFGRKTTEVKCHFHHII
ncbi:PREDICTED: uncharacterized protein LOC105578436 [Cercocebus atys]|uniref:uncharacterized protein LOC105578436 n=1 Tax=Cercocebus atys TaxID=9531 RepID=UPI0005F440EA|nr:PREDICTED: uncharacterized protein LOC105578436 [Cercocebus atys]